jgi:hypothetical protein
VANATEAWDRDVEGAVPDDCMGALAGSKLKSGGGQIADTAKG